MRTDFRRTDADPVLWIPSTGNSAWHDRGQVFDDAVSIRTRSHTAMRGAAVSDAPCSLRSPPVSALAHTHTRTSSRTPPRAARRAAADPPSSPAYATGYRAVAVQIASRGGEGAEHAPPPPGTRCTSALWRTRIPPTSPRPLATPPSGPSSSSRRREPSGSHTERDASMSCIGKPAAVR